MYGTYIVYLPVVGKNRKMISQKYLYSYIMVIFLKYNVGAYYNIIKILPHIIIDTKNTHTHFFLDTFLRI